MGYKGKNGIALYCLTIAATRGHLSGALIVITWLPVVFFYQVRETGPLLISKRLRECNCVNNHDSSLFVFVFS
jgi:hypothetical protein